MSGDDTLLEKADALFHKGRFGESNRILETLWEQGTRTSFIAACIGRNHRYDNQLDDAQDWLDRALEIAPVFSWVHFERAALFQTLKDPIRAAAAGESLLDAVGSKSGGDVFNAVHRKTLIACGHGCFGKDVGLARRLYAKLAALGIEDYLVLLRVLEACIDEGRLDDARRQAEALRLRYDVDAWGHLALSRLAQLEARTDDAVDHLRRAIGLQPANLFLRQFFFQRLVEFERFDLLDEELAAFEASESFGPDERAAATRNLRFQMGVRRGDSAGLLAEIARGELRPGPLPEHVVIDTIYRLLSRKEEADLELAGLLVEQLQAREKTSAAATEASIFAWMQLGQRRRAEALMEEVLARGEGETPGFVLQRFELACTGARLNEAAEIYARYWQGRLLTVSESAWAIRFLMETKRNGEAEGRARSLLERRMPIPQGEYQLLQLARRTDCHEIWLAILQADPPDEQQRDTPWHRFATRLMGMLSDDLCVRLGTDRVDLAAGGIAVSDRNAILVKTGMDAEEDPAEEAPPGRAIFLCTDTAYFFSSMTMIASCAANLDARGRHVEWFLFVSTDVPRPWRRAAEVLAVRLDINLRVVDEETFLSGGGDFAVEYGLFTGGNKLARAAYYRIYAARWLHGTGRFQRALYLDTDIICQADLLRLLEMDMEGAPMAARSEEMSPEVRTAALRCGVEAERYFNSGVLLLDFTDPATPALLEAAIQASETEPERLTFHDQCALNIGFAGRVTPLPAAYNHFLRPHRADNGDLSTAVLLHFVDRPKPWDVAFDLPYRTSWLRYAAVVRQHLPASVYQELVAVANGGKVAPPPPPAPLPESDADEAQETVAPFATRALEPDAEDHEVHEVGNAAA